MDERREEKGLVVDGDGWEWRSMMVDKEEMDG
jgi:hypothetical protein